MKISERIEGTIENWRIKWGDTLKGWMASWFEKGILTLMEALEVEARPSATEFIDTFPMPPEVKKILEAYMTKRSPIHLPAVAVMAIGVVLGSLIGVFMGWAAPIGKWTSYVGDKLIHSARLDPLTAIRAYWRGFITEERLISAMQDQGWSDADIEAIRKVTHFYPAPVDLVRWQAREVFEPEMIARYGLDSEFEAIDKEPFYKAGMTDEQILNYWRAHWEHASWMQVVEMLHRDLITEEEVYDWFRVVEIPPYWRDLLIQTAYTWPTRVDVRRWWDMRTIDETELRRLYSGMGYRGVNLENYIRWTKVYVDFPMMMTRFRNGWITEENIREWLRRLEIPESRITQFIEEKTKPEGPARVAEELDLTKAEIIKGVKKGVITEAEGRELLMDIGKSEAEADYILAINLAAEAGSPETFDEFKSITQRYKIAVGREEKPMPEELIKAGEEVVRLTGEVEALQKAIKEEERGLIPGQPLPKKATKKRDELRVALHRAEAELAAAKTGYDAKVAEWKHGV